jgi:hypothetical protein
VKTVDGDLINGVRDVDSKEMWIKPLTYDEIDLKTSPEVEKDPYYSMNVWGSVFKHMQEGNYILADQEKVKVEEAQRTRTDVYESRFGFAVPESL